VDEERDVVVVGGGPAGSTTALLLAQLGHDVLLLDEARFPRDKVCGEALSPGAWRVLEAIGAAAPLRRAGARPLGGMRLTAPDGTSFTGLYDGGRTTGFALERRVLDAALLDVARDAGVEVREGTRARDVIRNGTAVVGVAVGRDDAESRNVRARVVIGADGRRSVVARRLGFLREAQRPRRFAVRGHWEGMQGLSDVGEMHVAAGAYCGIAPLPHGRANVTFVVDQAAMPAAAGRLAEFYERRLRDWPRVWERLAGASLMEPPRALGPLALESDRAWTPGALLVGDAAGFFDPFTGEGMAAALRGAERAASVAHGFVAGATNLSIYGRLHDELVGRKFRFNRAVQWMTRHRRLANAAARLLALSPAAADRLVGIAGDCLPHRIRPGYTPLSCRMTSTELRPRGRR
jgi:geranylgeranyl reductase family protein